MDPVDPDPDIAPYLTYALKELASRVDRVKEENLRLRSENQVLGQYIHNLMAASQAGLRICIRISDILSWKLCCFRIQFIHLME